MSDDSKCTLKPAVEPVRPQQVYLDLPGGIHHPHVESKRGVPHMERPKQAKPKHSNSSADPEVIQAIYGFICIDEKGKPFVKRKDIPDIRVALQTHCPTLFCETEKLKSGKETFAVKSPYGKKLRFRCSIREE
jgi:hypothetical protein